MAEILGTDGKKMIKAPKCPFSLVIQFIVNTMMQHSMSNPDGRRYDIDLKCETCTFYNLMEKKCLILSLKKPTISEK